MLGEAMRGSLQERFDCQTCPEPMSGCLLWTGRPERVGYGQIRAEGAKRMAHHVAFFLANGRWPNGKLLHSCDVMACVNVTHLREGTQKDNMQDCLARGRNFAASKTVCKNGHSLTPDNVYAYEEGRHCKACVLERGRRRRSK